MKKSGASSSAMSVKGFKPYIKDSGSAAMTTKGEKRVDQALEVEAAKVINNYHLKIRRHNTYLPLTVRYMPDVSEHAARFCYEDIF